MRFLLAILMLTGLSVTAQVEKYEGVQASPTSSYYTTIMYNEEKDELKIINFSFEEDEFISEVIKKVENNKIFTFLNNKDNNYSVNIIYELLNDNQILCVFDEDIN